MYRKCLHCRRSQKIVLFALTGIVLVLWQLTHSWQATPDMSEMRENPDHFHFPLPKPTKKRLHVLRKAPEVYLQNNSLILLSESQTAAQVEENFFRYLESKDVRCSKSQRLGHPHDGGWNVCLSPPYGLHKPCIVFSFGINHDWQFDDAISIIHKCSVYSYDPSMGMEARMRDEHIKFEPTGLGWKDETNHNGWKLKTFRTYLRELDLTGYHVDYLKFDVEYSEWDILETMVSDGSLTNVKQIGFEIHSSELFRAFKINISTKKKDYLKMYRTLRKIEDVGFLRYDHRRNPFGEFVSNITGITRACCYELYFLNMRFFTEYRQREKKARERQKDHGQKLFEDR